MQEHITRRRRRMSAGPDCTDDELWNARSRQSQWVVKRLQANSELVTLPPRLGGTLEEALRTAHGLAQNDAGSLMVTAIRHGEETVAIYGRQIWRLWNRLGLEAARSLNDEYADLVEDWRVKQDAVLRFQPYERGWMKMDALTEHEALAAAERAARQRIDDFVAAHP